MKIILSSIYPYAFLLLYLILPFDNYIRALPNMLMIGMAATFPFVVQKSDFQKIKTPQFFLFVAFVVFLLLNAIMKDQFMADFNIIKKILIVLGLVVLYIPVRDTEKVENGIIFSALGSILFSLINITIVINTSGGIEAMSFPKLIEALLIDRLYLGLICVISILISFKSIEKSFQPKNKYHLANIFLNLLFLLLVVSKIALVTLFVVLLFGLLYKSPKRWLLGGILITMGIIVLTVYLTGLTKAMEGPRAPTSQENENPTFLQNTFTWGLRTITWSCGLEIAKSNGISVFGLGVEATSNQLVACYEDTISPPDKKALFVEKRYNTHNQYLDIYLTFGLVGSLLFLLFLLTALFRNRAFFYPTTLLLTFMVFLMFENLFHRQIGSYYVGYIMIIALALYDSINIKIKGR
ncbi:O-antigen ligase family protein [Luteirhabdus pelagi]|uniref:O-antigen ligase family protein n=1 Tax=Luteirhabdus pelagi TaxID=2792783 RepID=UPI00193A65D7|nr:O-antigen ligase family protein [Luteirhabdus pelagi]